MMALSEKSEMRRRRGADRPECRRQVVEGGAAGRYDGEWDTKFSCHEPSISAWVRQEPSQLRRQVRQITMEQGLRTRTAVSTRITRIRLAFGTRCEAMGVQPSIGTVDDAYDGTMARWQKAFSLGGNASRSTAGLENKNGGLVSSLHVDWVLLRPVSSSQRHWPAFAEQFRKALTN